MVQRCDGLVCVALPFVLQSGAFRWADAARYTVRKAAPPAAAPFYQSAQKFSCLNDLALRFESEETRADVAGTVQLLPQQAGGLRPDRLCCGGAPVVDRSFPLKPVRRQIRPAQRATSTTALVRKWRSRPAGCDLACGQRMEALE